MVIKLIERPPKNLKTTLSQTNVEQPAAVLPFSWQKEQDRMIGTPLMKLGESV